MKQSRFRAVVVLVLFSLAVVGSGCAYLVGQSLGLPPAEYSLKKPKTVMLPMRDGVRLASDIYLPRTDKALPAVIVRTPYGKGDGKNMVAKMFAQRGYVTVVQDVRGRYESEGTFYPFRNEREDGEDTLKWVKKQSWCNGKIGLYGASYYAFTTWRIADSEVGKQVDAWAPSYIGSSIYDAIYRQGIMKLLTAASWGFGIGTQSNNNGFNFIPGSKLSAPIVTLDDRSGRDLKFFDDWAAHPQFDSYWKTTSAEGRWDNVNAPALIMTGWYDFVYGATLRDWNSLLTKAGPEARKSSLVIGPWAHGGAHKLAGVDFGKQANFMAFSNAYFKWFDKYLYGNADQSVPRVQVFTMGINEWRNFSAWPPPDMRTRAWYFHSGGQANRIGDGAFNNERPSGNEPADSFTHDPDNPVPTTGGAVFPYGAGPADQSALSRRDDVLVYQTGKLGSNLELTGPITAHIWMSADTPDADITVALLDVDPSGTARVIADGIARARYRNGSSPTWLKKNEPTELVVDLWATSNVFRQGHQLRIHVAASNYPRFATNPCTTADPATTKNFVKSHIKVYHDADHPSRIILPIR